MKKIICYTVLFFLIACKKQSSTNECNPVPSIISTTIPSMPCTGTGAITITSPTGSQYNYKINNLSFQKSNEFKNLKPGLYSITVATENNCTSNTNIIVDTVNSGFKFKAVAQLLSINCVPCHTGFNPQAGLNFLNACDILQHWERIKARAVDGNPTSMPPLGLIPLSERNKIIDWINSGHRYED